MQQDPLDPYANASLSACCQSAYLGPYASAKAEPLASGNYGGAPGGATTGAGLGLKRCCPLVATGMLASVSTYSTRLERGRRRKRGGSVVEESEERRRRSCLVNVGGHASISCLSTISWLAHCVHCKVGLVV